MQYSNTLPILLNLITSALSHPIFTPIGQALNIVRPFPIPETTFTLEPEHIYDDLPSQEVDRTLKDALTRLSTEPGGPSGLAESDFTFPEHGTERAGYAVKMWVRAEWGSLRWKDFADITQGLRTYEHSIASGAKSLFFKVKDRKMGGQVIAEGKVENVSGEGEGKGVAVVVVE